MSENKRLEEEYGIYNVNDSIKKKIDYLSLKLGVVGPMMRCNGHHHLTEEENLELDLISLEALDDYFYGIHKRRANKNV